MVCLIPAFFLLLMAAAGFYVLGHDQGKRSIRGERGYDKGYNDGYMSGYNYGKKRSK